MNVLVTGGCGFIGSAFIRSLLRVPLTTGVRVVNLDALTYASDPTSLAEVAADGRYRFVHGDIGDSATVAHVLASEAIAGIVNFAAETHVDRSIASPDPFVRTNVVGLSRLLQTATAHWQRLPERLRTSFRFVHVSSDEVYGPLTEDEPGRSESSSFAPSSPYAASKAAGDHFALSYFRTFGLPVITTNGSNTYGPWQFPEKLIPVVIVNALAGKQLPLYGDGEHVRDWLYVDDHAAGVRSALISGAAGERYNIGGGNERTNNDLVRAICRILDARKPRSDGKSYATQIAYVDDRPGHDRRYAMNCEKARAQLGWSPVRDFEAGLTETIDWYIARHAGSST